MRFVTLNTNHHHNRGITILLLVQRFKMRDFLGVIPELRGHSENEDLKGSQGIYIPYPTGSK